MTTVVAIIMGTSSTITIIVCSSPCTLVLYLGIMVYGPLVHSVNSPQLYQIRHGRASVVHHQTILDVIIFHLRVSTEGREKGREGWRYKQATIRSRVCIEGEIYRLTSSDEENNASCDQLKGCLLFKGGGGGDSDELFTVELSMPQLSSKEIKTRLPSWSPDITRRYHRDTGAGTERANTLKRK